MSVMDNPFRLLLQDLSALMADTGARVHVFWCESEDMPEVNDALSDSGCPFLREKLN
jgi:hypothetical protein